MDSLYDRIFSQHPELDSEINKIVEARMKRLLSPSNITGDRNEPGLGEEDEVVGALKEALVTGVTEVTPRISTP